MTCLCPACGRDMVPVFDRFGGGIPRWRMTCTWWENTDSRPVCGMTGPIRNEKQDAIDAMNSLWFPNASPAKRSMLGEKERKIILEIKDRLMSDGTDSGDACVRVSRRQITEMLGDDYLEEPLLMEKQPMPLYFPENY